MTDQITLTAREYADKFDLFMAAALTGIVAADTKNAVPEDCCVSWANNLAKACMAARGYVQSQDQPADVSEPEPEPASQELLIITDKHGRRL